MTASIRSCSRNFLRISFSAPPRKSTPWGMTVVTMPPALQTASMCWANMRSPFLPVVGAPAPAEALWELHVGSGVVLAERRIGDDPVEALQFAGLAVHRVEQRVLELDVGARHAVQQHVQLADRPGGGVVHLAAEPEVRRVAAGLLDVFAADDQHAAGAASRIVDAHARARA